jgi:hypothetical protein
MRCLRILVLTIICPILRYYIGDAGVVGSEVAGDKDYTGGTERDARRGASLGTQGAAQVAGRKARCKSRDAVNIAGRIPLGPSCDVRIQYRDARLQREVSKRRQI